MTNFAYNRDIPNAPNNPSIDQPRMKVNNNNIQDLLGVDHVSFNAANGGYHTDIHLINNGGDPAAVANVGQLYTKNVAAQVNLYYESDLGIVTLLTNNFARNANGFFLIGGVAGQAILVRWGKAAATSGVAVPFGAPNFSAPPYTIQLSVNSNSTKHRTFVSYNTATNASFIPTLLDTNGNNESDTIDWLAIGPF